LVSINNDILVVDVNGVGYELQVAHYSDLRINNIVLLNTYLQVRDDGLSLFGFTSLYDKYVFLSLIKAKGVGPKSAINMINNNDTNVLVKNIIDNNINALHEQNGVSNKVANQLVIDLSNKLKPNDSEALIYNSLNDRIDICSALKALGYKSTQINPILCKLDYSLSIDQCLKAALILLSNGNS
ncbi:MAG: Holliday junction branch migration protein RuvA, partial [Erysipelotrichaceae bacterium]